jgi:hypothetical protein
LAVAVKYDPTSASSGECDSRMRTPTPALEGRREELRSSVAAGTEG